MRSSARLLSSASTARVAAGWRGGLLVEGAKRRRPTVERHGKRPDALVYGQLGLLGGAVVALHRLADHRIDVGVEVEGADIAVAPLHALAEQPVEPAPG